MFIYAWISIFFNIVLFMYILYLKRLVTRQEKETSSFVNRGGIFKTKGGKRIPVESKEAFAKALENQMLDSRRTYVYLGRDLTCEDVASFLVNLNALYQCYGGQELRVNIDENGYLVLVPHDEP